MYGFVLQDWVSVKSLTSAAPIIQNESDWLGFSSFADIAFWIDIRAFSTSTGTLLLELQTSPTKDDGLFKTMNSVSPVVVGTPISPIPKTLLASNPAVPLATWVRWIITPSASATWDITFRILASANRVTA